jgi:hypothetical protein
LEKQSKNYVLQRIARTYYLRKVGKILKVFGEGKASFSEARSALSNVAKHEGHVFT